jgi:hypothetical protein
MRDHHHAGLYQREQASSFVNVLNLAAVALLLPMMVPVAPRATIREKCTDTPGGAIAVISGSTVGLPGGMRKPRRARHPFMVAFHA